MSKTIRCLVWGSAALVFLAGCAAKPRAPEVGGDFSYELPNMKVPLAGVDFEYVMFGVTGLAEMEPIREEMYDKGAIGLVNIALSDLYRQVAGLEGGRFALVNIVTDISSRKTVRTVQTQNGPRTDVQEDPEMLIIRADVIQILSTGPVSSGGAAPGEVGYWPIDDDAREQLALELAQGLEPKI